MSEPVAASWRCNNLRRRSLSGSSARAGASRHEVGPSGSACVAGSKGDSVATNATPPLMPLAKFLPTGPKIATNPAVMYSQA